MRPILLLISALVLAVVFPSCTSSVVPVVGGPVDSTITNVELDNYINRTYIALLNRKPSESERADAESMIDVNRYDRSIRSSYISSLQERSSSKWASWQFLSDRLIDGEDTASMYDARRWYKERYENAASVGDEIYWGGLYEKANNHIEAMEGFLSGDTSYTALINRMVLLSNYEEINAGTENYVVSIYQHFFHRYPSDVELEQASAMLDLQWGILYGQNGNSKEEFLDIIFQSGEYQQGTVITLFETYINRTPSTEEIIDYTNEINDGASREDLQRRILTSSEYVNS